MNQETAAPRFAHLHVHSSYSIGVGLSTPEELCAHAARLGFDTLALTDTNGTYGFLEFHLAAKKHGIKPIYGAVVHHTSIISPGRERFPIALLAIDRTGLKNLAELTSLSATAFESGVALSLDQVRHRSDGVVALAGGTKGELASLLLADDDSAARAALDALLEMFGRRLFVEIQDHGEQEEKALAQSLLALASDGGANTVFAQEVRYTNAEMRELYELFRGVRHPNDEEDFFRIEAHSADHSLRPPSEIERYRTIYEEGVASAARIAGKVEADLLAGIDHPSKLLDHFGDSRQSLIERCRHALYKRYRNLSNSEIAHYQAIIEREAAEIEAAGLVPAFLLYHHLLSGLRRSGTHLGPATGVNFQSCCAFLLGVTSYDPYHYTPDFRPMFDTRAEAQAELEIQVPSDERDAAVEALTEMVGAHALVYAPAIERFTPARAVRMVAGIVDVEQKDVDEILKIVARHPGVSIKRMSEVDWGLGRVYRRSVRARELLRRASLLEDLPCGFIKSRRSVALSATPLTECLAHSVDADTGDVFVHVSRDILPVEPVFRIDFTPLNALRIVAQVEDTLPDAGENRDRWDRFPLDDARVWREIREGDPTGVFLFEGQIIRQQRNAFELRRMSDLANLLTIMRARADARTLTERINTYQRGAIFSGADPPEVFRILKSTNGHLLYDEQIRDVLSIFIGADSLESVAMLNDAKAGDPSGLSRVRGRFMRGMADHDMPMDLANDWFERILFYAKQTIRRERVLADAILVYRMFYLKVHHGLPFYMAVLNANHDNGARLSKYMEELDAQGLLLPLDVNSSRMDFVREGEWIRAGFWTVPSLDRSVVDRLMEEREIQPFATVEDFVSREGLRKVGKEQLQLLVRAGAFDALADSRKAATQAVGKMARKKKRAPRVRDKSQLELPFEG